MDPTGIVKQQFSVPFAYTVAFTRDVFAPQNDLLPRILTEGGRGSPRALVVLDSGVAAAFPGLVARIREHLQRHAINLVGTPLVIPGGEVCKNDPAVGKTLLDALANHHLDRHAYVVIVGGGAVLDAAGYAAALVHRGLRTVRLPTTVLSQNDGGVGVKNGVNAYGAKNFLGTFHPPAAVINDFAFLDRLPARDRVAGYAEAVKVALIRDHAFFTWLSDNRRLLARGDRDAVAILVRRAADMHLAHIARGGDPLERGSGRPLDYGHWAAHKLESMTHHDLRHGEAVAIGMTLDARYAVLTGRLSSAAFDRVAALISDLGLPTWHEALEVRKEDGTLAVLDGLEDFREHLGGALTVTLLDDIGRGTDVEGIDRDVMTRAIAELAPARMRHVAP